MNESFGVKLTLDRPALSGHVFSSRVTSARWKCQRFRDGRSSKLNRSVAQFSPVLVLPESIDLDFFPLGATLHKVKISLQRRRNLGESLIRLRCAGNRRSDTFSLATAFAGGECVWRALKSKAPMFPFEFRRRRKKCEKPLEGLLRYFERDSDQPHQPRR